MPFKGTAIVLSATAAIVYALVLVLRDLPITMESTPETTFIKLD